MSKLSLPHQAPLLELTRTESRPQHAKMVNQQLNVRYINKAKLFQLLKTLFGTHYHIEVPPAVPSFYLR